MHIAGDKKEATCKNCSQTEKQDIRHLRIAKIHILVRGAKRFLSRILYVWNGQINKFSSASVSDRLPLKLFI